MTVAGGVVGAIALLVSSNELFAAVVLAALVDTTTGGGTGAARGCGFFSAGAFGFSTVVDAMLPSGVFIFSK